MPLPGGQCQARNKTAGNIAPWAEDRVRNSQRREPAGWPWVPRIAAPDGDPVGRDDPDQSVAVRSVLSIAYGTSRFPDALTRGGGR